ncbi:hypothetical protein Poli38472_011473 [Pythium oligandrum]|uniref:Uncharacterized protein n=1 Tax=Pythium oligandrum TaxID=41045 RepID=A0A8K1CKF0_PYTOL|nr:hypothetical protein Poli38472_011473 [Pythium oligandrum]|eukprot:TMW64593.1 hypothetical protein Poli38472_011473 [Pythium oligandrum]
MTTQYMEENTARANERLDNAMPAAYDEKDDMAQLKEKLAARKKPIIAGLALLCIVIIGISIGVSTGGGKEASTSSGQNESTEETPAPTPTHAFTEIDSEAGGVHAADSDSTKSAASSRSGSSNAVLEAGVISGNSTTPTPTPSPSPSTEAPTPSPTDGPILPFHAVDFDWTNPSNWEYSSGRSVGDSVFTDGGIKLTPANSAEPIRTKKGWGGEKIVLIEWERSETSDTNIWMLNTKLQNQFGVGNGWPYWGELDIFEMFTQDAADKRAYDFSGFGTFSNVASYGQLTLHNGPRTEDGQPCFCPSAASKSSWYKNTAPMTSGCTAQFSNTPKNAIATVWGTDGTGQYLQLIQNPTITKGGKLNNAQTFDIGTGSGAVTSKIYNNKELFWGTPASSACAVNGGHNPNTGFPFFEDFRLILEEQKKGDSSAWFKVTNIQIFVKN